MFIAVQLEHTATVSLMDQSSSGMLSRARKKQRMHLYSSLANDHIPHEGLSMQDDQKVWLYNNIKDALIPVSVSGPILSPCTCKNAPITERTD